MSLLGWTLSDRFFLQAWVHGLVPHLHDAGRTFYELSVAGRDDHDAVLTPFQPGQVAHSFAEHCHTKYHVSVQDVKASRLSELFPVRSVATVPFAGSIGNALPLHALQTRGQRRVQFRNNRYDDDGKPLCNKCGSPDHLARECPARPPSTNSVAQVLWKAYDDYLAADGQDTGDDQLTLEEFAVQAVQDFV